MVSYDLSRVFGLLPEVHQALPRLMDYVCDSFDWLILGSVGLGSDC